LVPGTRNLAGVYWSVTYFYWRWRFVSWLMVYIPLYLCSLGGPIVIAGVALGIQSVSEAGSQHINDTHKVRITNSIHFFIYL